MTYLSDPHRCVGATERQSGRSPRPSRACRRRTGRGGVGTPMCTHLPRRDHRKTAPTTPPPAAASWPAPGHLPARVAGTQAYPATSWRLGQYRTCRPTSTMRSKPPRTTRHPVPARTRHPHRGGTATDDTPALAAAEHIDLSARWPLTPTCSPAASPAFCTPQPRLATAGLSTCVTASRSSAGAAASSAARVAWQPAQPPR